MPDVVDQATRSRMMSGIRGKNTKPEIRIRCLLHRCGFRFRLHVKHLPGKPDIVLPRYRAIVFVNGCFWHGHDCSLFKWPNIRAEWWRAKIEQNMVNDERSQLALKDAGWSIAVVWECALKGRDRIPDAKVSEALSKWLRTPDRVPVVIRGIPPEPSDLRL